MSLYCIPSSQNFNFKSDKNNYLCGMGGPHPPPLGFVGKKEKKCMSYGISIASSQISSLKLTIFMTHKYNKIYIGNSEKYKGKIKNQDIQFFCPKTQFCRILRVILKKFNNDKKGYY